MSIDKHIYKVSFHFTVEIQITIVLCEYGYDIVSRVFKYWHKFIAIETEWKTVYRMRKKTALILSMAFESFDKRLLKWTLIAQNQNMRHSLSAFCCAANKQVWWWIFGVSMHVLCVLMNEYSSRKPRPCQLSLILCLFNQLHWLINRKSIQEHKY